MDEKKTPRQALQAAYNASSSELTNWSNPGNADKINIALGLLNAESADTLTDAIGNLKRQLVGVSETIQKESKDMIDANTRTSNSNEKYARAMMWLTGALVFVGLLQVVALVWQTLHH